jgi:hypothetical protein
MPAAWSAVQAPVLAVRSTERVEFGAMWTTRGELVNIGGWPEAVAAKPTLRFGQAGGLLFGS